MAITFHINTIDHFPSSPQSPHPPHLKGIPKSSEPQHASPAAVPAAAAAARDGVSALHPIIWRTINELVDLCTAGVNITQIYVIETKFSINACSLRGCQGSPSHVHVWRKKGGSLVMFLFWVSSRFSCGAEE